MQHKELIMTNCVICEIVAGSIPSWIVYQDTEVICFLPKMPEAYGHTIIAPKVHYPDLYAAPEALLEHLIVAAKKLAVHYRDRIGSSGVNLLHASGVSAQQSVLHLHIHLLPRFDNDGLNAWPKFPTAQYDKNKLLEELRLHD
ncbi:MAG: HIT domain-containing protein [Chloroflexota bacterium]|nr:HIT domain-containing protein [Chloroflexota bacterium]